MSHSPLKVVKILDRYELVINKGSLDGILQSDQFIIYELGEEIHDPDSNKSLGWLEKVKGKAEVKHLQDKLTVIISNEYVDPFQNLTSASDILTGIRSRIPFKDVKVGDLVKVSNRKVLFRIEP